MGLELFERTDEGFKLTLAGRKVRAEAQIQAIVAELSDRVGESSGGQSGLRRLRRGEHGQHFAPYILRSSPGPLPAHRIERSA